jgi:hypothetical protein
MHIGLKQMDEQVEETKETLIQEPQESSPERPEWLPEKFNTPEDLGKAYTELSTKLGAKQEDIIKDYNNERFINRPETKGDYELPESIDASQATDNELLNWWSEHAFNNGFSQDQFKEGIEMYAKGIEAAIPQNDLKAEAEKLGDNANTRIEAVSMFANKFFPDELSGAVEKLGETAEGIMLIEHIMSKNKDTQISAESTPVSSFDESDLQAMMQDERYWNATRRDPHFVKQVDDGFKKLYG